MSKAQWGSDLLLLPTLNEWDFMKIKAEKIYTRRALLRALVSSARRHTFSKRTLIDFSVLTRHANHCDLTTRIKGLGPKYLILLEKSGCPTVRDLGSRNPKNLFARMLEVNMEERLVEMLPSKALVNRWVDQAKQLKVLISYF